MKQKTEHTFRALYDGKMLYNAGRIGDDLYYDNGKGHAPFAFIGNPPPIMMQNTGFKDKHGIAIYENDMLQIELDGEEYKSPVFRKHGCWVIYHRYRTVYEAGDMDTINFGYWIAHDNVAVIGNIHTWGHIVLKHLYTNKHHTEPEE